MMKIISVKCPNVNIFWCWIIDTRICIKSYNIFCELFGVVVISLTGFLFILDKARAKPTEKRTKI